MLGNSEALGTTLEGLQSAEGYLRRELARIVNLRNTPQIRFIPDDSIAYGVDMSKKIDEVIAQDESRHVPSPGESGEEGLEGGATV